MGILNNLEKKAIIGLAAEIIFSAGIVKAEEFNYENAPRIPPKIIKNLSPEDKKRELREYTKYLVLHTTESSDKSSINSTKNDGSTNYLILKNGDIHEIIQEGNIACHAGKSVWNGDILLEYYSIGIEVSGFHHEALTSEQEFSSEHLIKNLQKKYNILDEEVLIHAAVASTDIYGENSRRGRKIDGLNINMKRIGILKRPEYDPDVKSGLVSPDRVLSKLLYPNQEANNSKVGQVSNRGVSKDYTLKRIKKIKKSTRDYLRVNDRFFAF